MTNKKMHGPKGSCIFNLFDQITQLAMLEYGQRKAQ